MLDGIYGADVLVLGSPVYWHDLSGMMRNVLDRCYGPVPEDGLAGRKLFFLFQGAAPTQEIFQRAEYTIKRFAALYGMEYAGMATNAHEARELARRL